MKVQTIKVKDGKTLAEWTDEALNVRRSWFPADSIKDGEVKDPERGLAHGDDLGSKLGKLPNKETIVQALHNQGLWSYEDVAANPSKVQTALATVYAPLATSLLTPKGD